MAGVILLYDKDLTLIGPLDRALTCEVEQKLNELSPATIELAAQDELVSEIDVPASFARIYDGDEDLGYYRFAEIPRDEHAPLGKIQYRLQSGECTLLDGMLSGWHEIGGTGMSTRDVLEYILRYQSAQGATRWVLGDCEFTDYYQYNFEDVTLLEAIMSLGEVLLEPYVFVFDTTVTPWTMHLRRAVEDVCCSLVYRRNMTSLRRSVSGGVVTRLYGRGYGEGDNQLTIASVNGGRDYLDADAASIAKWGIREGVHVDTRQTDPATLKARMQAILQAGQQPQVTYEADAIDLHEATGMDWDNVAVGSRVMVLDELLGDCVTVRVTARKKSGLDGHGTRISYVLDNSVADTAEELNEILDKIGVHELYSQGATNMYSMQISDNADTAHPLTMRFYVPGNVLRINSCRVCWKIERFRTYVTLVEAAKEVSRTSKSGGGATVTLPAQTISVGVKTTGDPIDEDGGADPKTGGPVNYLGESNLSTSSAGSHNHSMTHTHIVASHTHAFTGTSKTYSIAHNHSLAGDGALATGGIYSGNKNIQVTPEGELEATGVVWTSSAYDAVGGSAMAATGNSGTHTHTHEHVHRMPHVHSMAHEHVIPAMVFTLEAHSHTYVIPEHTHDLTYGVYEGARAEALRLRVDGVDVPAEAIGEDDELDVAPYLRKNADGKVVRETWHELEFVPDGLTRLTADLFFQVFIQSRGAGDY